MAEACASPDCQEEIQRLRADNERLRAHWKERIVSDLQDAVEATFDDGSSVMAYVLASRPDINKRLREVLRP